MNGMKVVRMEWWVRMNEKWLGGLDGRGGFDGENDGFGWEKRGWRGEGGLDGGERRGGGGNGWMIWRVRVMGNRSDIVVFRGDIES